MRKTVSWLTSLWLLTAACSAAASERTPPVRVVKRPHPLYSSTAFDLRDIYQDSDATALLYKQGRFELYTDEGGFYHALPEEMCGIVAKAGRHGPVFLIGSPLGSQLQFFPEEGVKSAFPILYKLVEYARQLPELKKDIAYICTNLAQDRLAFLTSSEEASSSADRRRKLHYYCLNKQGKPVSSILSFADEEKVSYKNDLDHLCLRMLFLEDDTLVFLSDGGKQLIVFPELFSLRKPWAYQSGASCLGIEKAAGGNLRMLMRKKRGKGNRSANYGYIENIDCSKGLSARSRGPVSKYPLPENVFFCRALAPLGGGCWAYTMPGERGHLNIWDPLSAGRSLLYNPDAYTPSGREDRWWAVRDGRLCYYMPVNPRQAVVGHLPVAEAPSYARLELQEPIKHSFPVQTQDGGGVFVFTSPSHLRFYAYSEQGNLPQISESDDIDLGFAVDENTLLNAVSLKDEGGQYLALQAQLSQEFDSDKVTVVIHDLQNKITRVPKLSGGGANAGPTYINLNVERGPFEENRRVCQMRWHTPTKAAPILVLLPTDGKLQAWSIAGEPIRCALAPSLDPEADREESDEGKFCYLGEQGDLLLYHGQPEDAASIAPYHLYTYFYDDSKEKLVVKYLSPLPVPDARYYRYLRLGKDISTLASYEKGRKENLVVAMSDGGNTKIWESCLPASDGIRSLAAVPEAHFICDQPLPPTTCLRVTPSGFIMIDEAGSVGSFIPLREVVTSGYVRKNTEGLYIPQEVESFLAKFVDLDRWRWVPTLYRHAPIEPSAVCGNACGILRPSRL